MSVDPATMLILTAIIMATVGMLLLFAWAQNRSHGALAAWGASDLLAAVAIALLMTRNHAPDSISVVLAFATHMVTYGLIWGAAVVFTGRRLPVLRILGGAAAWCLFCTITALYRYPEWRIVVTSAISIVYTLAAAGTLLRARGEHLLSRRPMIAVLVMHAGFLLVRASAAVVITLPKPTDILNTPWLITLTIEPIILAIASGFLLISMAKERAELRQRRVAATDALTGVASRRAFLDEGAWRLGTALKQGDQATVLLFDLDRFKQVNDGYGHHAGDHVLQLFAARIGETLRSDDLFGRIGGEEFAAVLTSVSVAQALEIAERCRATIEAFDFTLDGAPIQMTVSGGIAAATAADSTVESLLGQADRALYVAKSAGRNCVRAYAAPPAPIRLVA